MIGECPLLDPKRTFKGRLSGKFVRGVMSQVRRGEFLIAAGALLATCSDVGAQQAKIAYIGFLGATSPNGYSPQIAAPRALTKEEMTRLSPRWLSA